MQKSLKFLSRFCQQGCHWPAGQESSQIRSLISQLEVFSQLSHFQGTIIPPGISSLLHASGDLTRQNGQLESDCCGRGILDSLLEQTGSVSMPVLKTSRENIVSKHGILLLAGALIAIYYGQQLDELGIISSYSALSMDLNCDRLITCMLGL